MGLIEIITFLEFAYQPNFNHDNFCQNLYFQPNAIEQMEYFHCDIEQTTYQIQKHTH